MVLTALTEFLNLKTLDKLGTLPKFGTFIYEIKMQPRQAFRFSAINLNTVFFSLIIFEKYMNLQVLVFWFFFKSTILDSFFQYTFAKLHVLVRLISFLVKT